MIDSRMNYENLIIYANDCSRSECGADANFYDRFSFLVGKFIEGHESSELYEYLGRMKAFLIVALDKIILREKNLELEKLKRLIEEDKGKHMLEYIEKVFENLHEHGVYL